MSNGQRATGTPDTVYNLVTTLYNALKAAETAQQYVDDAQSAGDDEAADLLRTVQQQDQDRAERAKSLLKSRL